MLDTAELVFRPVNIPLNLIRQRRDMGHVVSYLLHELPRTTSLTYTPKDGTVRVTVLLTDKFGTSELQEVEKRIRATLERP